MNIDLLRSLEIFVAVAEICNVTKAAQSLGISQSAVSQQLYQLETELGRELVDRSVRPIALTPAGLLLHGKASQLLNQAAELRTVIQDVGWSVMPDLRIAVIGSLAGTLVPPLISSLTKQMNVGRVSVSRGLATTRENALLSREADMLITSDPLYEVEGLDRYPLFREPFILALPQKDGPWREQMSLSELATAGPYIRYTHRTQMGWAIETHLKRMRLVFANQLEFDNPDDIIAMVAAGLGWTITTPSHVLQGLRDPHAIRTIPFPGPEFKRAVSLIVRSDELGNVPRDVHAICTKVLEDQFLPGIRKSVAWLGDQFEIMNVKEVE